MGGAAGLVCAARDLDARLPTGPEYRASRETLGRVRERALAVLLVKHRAPLDPGPADYLGFGHGLAGELWALVAALGAEHEIVRARLAELAALRELDEEGLVYWLPARASQATFLLGTWCNGMAGHTLLWSEVARQTGSEESMDLARRCAESTSILSNGSPTLCCGLTGHAMALQRFADVSGEAAYARRAYRRLASALPLAEREIGSVFLGLWQGSLGIALVAMGRLCGERTIPCHEPPPSAP
jgi:hypothetical protein